MFLSETIERALLNLEVIRGVSASTISGYRWRLKKFMEFCGDIPIETLTLKHVEDYRLFLHAKLNDKGLKACQIVSINAYIVAIRAMLSYSLEEGLSNIVLPKIKLAKVRRKSVVYSTPEEITKMLDAVPGDCLTAKRDRAIISLLFSTGLRASEAASLNRDKIDFERKEFTIVGKGSKERLVFLNDRACELLKDYLSQREDDFPCLFIGYHYFSKNQKDIEKRRLSRHALCKIVKKYVRLAGIQKKITTHTLRHGMATTLYLSGADIRSVQEMLGHSSVNTTMFYTHVTNKHLREVHEKHHPGYNKAWQG